ncbi:hypothetical protein JNW89_24755 [Micromonospora sp. 4G55]|nr:hypothetical protein [Micromonospora sp. 4G55]MBM0259457.1 hypothetical protein [Micromonospora sp. 4G55]
MVAASSRVSATGSRRSTVSSGAAATVTPAVTPAVSSASRPVGVGPRRARCDGDGDLQPKPGTAAIAPSASTVASAPRSAGSSRRAPSTGTR